MPALSMFFGLIIGISYAPKEYNPPHIHAEYQGEDATVDISSGAVIDGYLSPRHLRFVQARIEIHKEELFADWNLCRNGEEPFKTDPLK
jgi:hypothetical protein